MLPSFQESDRTDKSCCPAGFGATKETGGNPAANKNKSPVMSIVYSNLNHPLRVPLAAEVHSRPPLRLTASESVTHFAVYARDAADPAADNGHSQQQLLCALCAHFGVAGPGSDAKYFFHDFGRFRLKWECHTEFATYTLAAIARTRRSRSAPRLSKCR